MEIQINVTHLNYQQTTLRMSLKGDTTTSVNRSPADSHIINKLPKIIHRSICLFSTTES